MIYESPIALLWTMQKHINQLYELSLVGLALMRELAGNDPVKIRKVEAWKASLVAVLAGQVAKDGEDARRDADNTGAID
jgi:hypothetical protein